MNEAQDKVNQLLAEFGLQHGAEFRLENDVCAICNPQGEIIAVVEVPSNSDTLILHSDMFDMNTAQDESQLLSALLSMNFQMDIMMGNWFASHNQQIHLMTQRDIKDLDEVRFPNLLNGFIQQAALCKQKVIALSQGQTQSEQWERFV